MSLGVVVKGPEGVVLAADSRVTLTAQRPGAPPMQVNFDNATKLLSLSGEHRWVGAVTYGAAVIGLRTAHSFIPEFEVELSDRGKRLSVLEYAELMSGFFLRQWQSAVLGDYQGVPMTFILGGYDPDGAYGRVFVFDIPTNPAPVEKNPGDDNFGMTWGGQLQIASRLIHGYDPALPLILKGELGLDETQLQKVMAALASSLEFTVPYQVLPLQDCVDLAALMVRTTMEAQNLGIGVRGVGGPTDIAVVTRTEGLKYIRRKSVTAGG